MKVSQGFFIMPASDQGLTLNRYVVIPRTAIFLRAGDSYLLLKGAPTKRLWANKYNCLGGHVERGEDVLAAAKRELMEEAGMVADLWLCGTLMVDAGESVGICLYFFTGETTQLVPQPSAEGAPEWIPLHRIPQLPVVDDLPVLLGRIHTMQRGQVPFAARSFYDEHQQLTVVFAD